MILADVSFWSPAQRTPRILIIGCAAHSSDRIDSDFCWCRPLGWWIHSGGSRDLGLKIFSLPTHHGSDEGIELDMPQQTASRSTGHSSSLLHYTQLLFLAHQPVNSGLWSNMKKSSQIVFTFFTTLLVERSCSHQESLRFITHGQRRLSRTRRLPQWLAAKEQEQQLGRNANVESVFWNPAYKRCHP